MSIDDVVAEMQLTGESVPLVTAPIRLEAPRWGTPASEAEVAELEAEVAGRLPDDYRSFLLRHGSVAAMDVLNGYDIFGARQALAITRGDDAPRQIRMGSDIVPVVVCGGDGGGNLFLLGTNGLAVFKWLHEYGIDDQQITHGRAIERLSTSFTAFLERVGLDWKHFVADNRDWKYIAG
jgi:SMI1 / KNR4 family (SUKH-1)